MVRNLTLIILSIFLNSCGKHDKTIISGTVLEHYSGEPVANAEIKLSYSAFSGGIYSSGYSQIGTTNSDANGHYTFEFENVSAVDFRFQTSAEHYYYRETKINRDEVVNGDKNLLALELYAKALMNFRFKNSTSVQNQLLFALEDHSPGCSDCCFSGSIFMSGITDTLVSCGFYGHEKINYEASTIKTSGTEVTSGTIEIIPGENEFDFNFD